MTRVKLAAENSVMPVGLLVLPLAVWGAHFLVSYIVAALYCAKSDDVAAAIVSIRWIVLVGTILALAAIGFALRLGHRKYRRNVNDRTARQSAPSNRAFFLWAVLRSVSALGAFAVLCVASVVFFFGDCQ